MKKILVVVILLLGIGIANVQAADINITIKIPDVKVQRVTDGVLAVYPIPQIPDPAWIDPGDGSEAPLIDEYTSKQWIKKLIVRYITSLVLHHERSLAEQTARDNINEDDVAE
jgi:hypothetical protein